MDGSKREHYITYGGRLPSVKEVCEDIKSFIEEHHSTPGAWTLRLYFGPLKGNQSNKINELAAKICLPPCSWYATSVESDRIILKVYVSK